MRELCVVLRVLSNVDKRRFSLCNYTFEVMLADKMEQLLTHALNVISVQQPFTLAGEQVM